MYKGLAVGGMLKDGSSTAHGMVNSNYEGSSYIGSFPPGTLWQKQWQFDDLNIGQAPPWNWTAFEKLAVDLQSVGTTEYDGGFLIVVEEQGADEIHVDATRYLGEEPSIRGVPQGEDNGGTLVVFTGNGTIFIEGTKDATAARQFGPSVLAPFAKVVIDGSAGFVDGLIVAAALDHTGSNADQVQLHGDLYKGPMLCPCDPFATQSADPYSIQSARSSVTEPTNDVKAVASPVASPPTPVTGAHSKKQAQIALHAALESAGADQHVRLEEPVTATYRIASAKRKLTVGAVAMLVGGTMIIGAMWRYTAGRQAPSDFDRASLLPTVDEMSGVEEFHN